MDFVVVAFGGAGGLHVAELTRRLGARKALVPPDPGLLSAYGMLASPVTRELSRTVLLDTDTPDVEERISTVLDDLEASARDSMVDEGLHPDDLTSERRIDARYRGQSFELGVPASGWVAAFHAAHDERYGYRRDETAVEAVTLRVNVTAPPPALTAAEHPDASGAPPLRTIRVVFEGIEHESGAVWRSDLAAGHELEGPLVVQEYSGTTWVPPHWSLAVDRWGCLHIER